MKRCAVACMIMFAVSLFADEPTDAKVIRWEAQKNPDGIQLGFWPNFNRDPEVVNDYGRRPITRSGFSQWKQIELSPGIYTWGNHFTIYERAHRNGSSVMANVNISCSSNNKDNIPDHYVKDITDPVTRAAATDFLEAYVSELLDRVGEVTLLIDYEPMSNFQLWDEENQQRYRDWFVYAAQTAKSVAASKGMSDLFRVALNVNGNILLKQNVYFGDALPEGGFTNDQWLLDCVAAADILTIDTYYTTDGTTACNDPVYTAPYVRDTFQFWIDNFSMGKPVFVAEHGFSSVVTEVPDFDLSGITKGRGTEEQQRDHFAALMPYIESLNLQGFCVWAYADRDMSNPAVGYLGTISVDDEEKPVYDVLRDEFDFIESGPRAPSLRYWRENVTSALVAGGPGAVGMTCSSGTDYDFLKYSGTIPAGATQVVLHVEADATTALVLMINGQWMEVTDEADLSGSYALDITPYVTLGTKNFIEAGFTQNRFPFAVKVSRFDVTYE